MKNKVFTNAWKLFKMYNITFAEALTKAWNDFKRSLLVEAYNKIASMNRTAKARAKQALDNFPTINQTMIRRNLVINSGAADYYNGSTYNAD